MMIQITHKSALRIQSTYSLCKVECSLTDQSNLVWSTNAFSTVVAVCIPQFWSKQRFQSSHATANAWKYIIAVWNTIPHLQIWQCQFWKSAPSKPLSNMTRLRNYCHYCIRMFIEQNTISCGTVWKVLSITYYKETTHQGAERFIIRVHLHQ